MTFVLHLRRLIDLLCLISAILASICLVAIAGLVTVQILARTMRVVVVSTDSLAGFALAGSVFLALPYTFRKGGHVRVSLLLGALNEKFRPFAELVCLTISAAVLGYFSYFSLKLTLDFHRFGDVSSSTLVVPLWIPQMMMTVGLSLFLLAIFDDIIAVLTRGRASYHDYSDTITEY